MKNEINLNYDKLQNDVVEMYVKKTKSLVSLLMRKHGKISTFEANFSNFLAKFGKNI